MDLVDYILNFILNREEGHTVALFLASDPKFDGVELERYASRSDKVLPHFKIRSGEGLIGFIAKQQKEVLLGNLTEKNRSSLGYYSSYLKIGSLAVYPVKRKGRFAGLLLFDRLENEERPLKAIGSLSSYAEMIEEAVELVRSTAEHQLYSDILLKVYSIIERIEACEGFSDKIREFKFSVRSIVQYDNLIITEKGSDRLLYTLNDNAEIIGEPLPLNSCRAGHVIAQNLTINSAIGESVLLAPNLKSGNYRSFLGAPVTIDSKAFWSLSIVSRRDQAFSKAVARGFYLLVSSLSSAFLAKRGDLLEREGELTIARRSILPFEKPFTDKGVLIFLSLIGFRYVNGELGFENGNKVLKEVLLRLQRIKVSKLKAKHYFADKFIIAADIKDESEATLLMKSILNKIEQEPFLVAGTEIIMKASLGATIYTGEAGDIDSLIFKSELAAKKARQMQGDKIFILENQLQKPINPRKIENG